MKLSRKLCGGTALRALLIAGFTTAFGLSASAQTLKFHDPRNDIAPFSERQQFLDSQLGAQPSPAQVAPAAKPAATKHDVDSYPSMQCSTFFGRFLGPSKFDGHLLYQCAFEGIMWKSFKEKDATEREAWAQDWEHKHDSDGMLDNEKSADKAVFEMVQSLGERFNYYKTPVATKAQAQVAQGSFSGIGAELTIGGFAEGTAIPQDTPISKEHPVTVLNPIEGAPAFGKIERDDQFTEVDGNSLDGKTLEEAVGLIKGPTGTKVTLTVVRGTQTLHITLNRGSVPIHEVVDHKFVTDDVYYFRLKSFEDNPNFLPEMKNAFKEGEKAKAIIIDLRNNPGGLLPYADWLVSSTLEEGRYLNVISRTGSKVSTEETVLEPDAAYIKRGNSYVATPRYPLLVKNDQVIIVLVNQGSASASEIVGQALKANHRATIVGKPTVGKGVGQTVIPLPFDREEDIISFTFKPGGKDLDWIGVIPNDDVDGDMKHAGDPVLDAQLKAAIDRANKEIAIVDHEKQVTAAQRQKHEDAFAKDQLELQKLLQGTQPNGTPNGPQPNAQPNGAPSKP
jgi:carboxyl-terminal processing protease